MEIVKYLCEFFFTNFWHWLGLVIMLESLFGIPFIKFTRTKKSKEEE